MSATEDRPEDNPGAGHESRTIPVALAVVAVLLLAANLRASVNVLGPLLPAIRSDLDLSGLQVGVLTALPTVCFALLSMLGARISAALGPHRVVVAALILMIVGQLLRALVPGVAALFLGTAVALAAIAVANVVMPALIAGHFPERVAAMTAAYTVTLAALGAAASAGTLPLQELLDGDWRVGIGCWAVLSVLALVPWVLMARAGRGPARAVGRRLQVGEIARVWRSWALALFFGLQALQAYVVFSWYPSMLADAGVPLTLAAAYVGLVSLASMAGSLVVPSWMSRLREQRPLVLLVNAGFVCGYLGTMFAPAAAPWLWALLLGLGTVCFPMGLYLLTQRASTGAGVLAQSGFVQGVGYLVAAVLLIVLGAWQGDSTNWTPLLVVMIVLTAVQTIAAFTAVSPWHVEAEIERGGGHPAGA